jgi:hypothetical protein
LFWWVAKLASFEVTQNFIFLLVVLAAVLAVMAAVVLVFPVRAAVQFLLCCGAGGAGGAGAGAGNFPAPRPAIIRSQSCDRAKAGAQYR